MVEDKLEHDERLRLECLAQAMNHELGLSRGKPGGTSAEQVLTTAARFERWVRSGDRNGA